MKHTDNINRILRAGRNTLRALHDCIGFDFEQDFAVIDLGGAFTVNKVLKMVQAAGFDSSAALAVIMRDRVAARGFGDRWHLVTLEGGRVNIEHSVAYYWNYENRHPVTLEHFYVKYDFEDMRKSATCEAFAIVQRAEYIRKPAAKAIDWSARFKVIPAKYSRLVLQVTGEKGARFDYFDMRHGRFITRETQRERDADRAEIIDHSGYLLWDRRTDLQRRAAALRAQREKAASDAQDYSGQVDALRRMIEALKRAIIRQLEAATTAAEIDAAGETIDNYLHGLCEIVWDFERFQRRAAEKGFSSPAHAASSYDTIVAKLAGEGV